MGDLPLRVYLSALKRKLKKVAGGGTPDPYLPLPEGTALSPSLGSAEALGNAPCSLSFTETPNEDPQEWQARARAKLSEITGYQVDRATPKVTVACDPVELEPGIVRQSFYLRVRAETDVPVHLIRPEGLSDPAPVFLHLAGSTSGVHLAYGVAKVPIDHQRLAIGADMALQAARRGYLGVAIEQAGFGERMERDLPKRSKNRTIDLANHLLLIGRTLMGDGASDVSTALDWLLSERSAVKVDPKKLFLFGHSAGGTLAQYAAALDPRICGVVASGSVGHVRNTIAARGAGGGDGIVPGFLSWFDSRDLIALVAPRPFAGVSGTADHIFPASGVSEVVEEARVFYERMGAANRLLVMPVDGPHQYHAQATWEAWSRIIDPT